MFLKSICPILFGFFAPLCAELHTFQAQQKNYLFSTVFDFTSDMGSVGSAVKSSFHVRTHYNLYDSFGKYEGQGICRILTLGLLFSWGTEIDIYDAEGNSLGMIDGQVATSASAKFSFYDREGERIGIAYLDRTSAVFTIVDPENEQRYLASLKRNFIADTIDCWDVRVFIPEAIDERILKVFASFAVDSQEYFKEDN